MRIFSPTPGNRKVVLVCLEKRDRSSDGPCKTSGQGFTPGTYILTRKYALGSMEMVQDSPCRAMVIASSAMWSLPHTLLFNAEHRGHGVRILVLGAPFAPQVDRGGRSILSSTFIDSGTAGSAGYKNAVRSSPL